MRRVVFCTALVALGIPACKKKDPPLPPLDSVDTADASIAEPGAGRGAQVPFRIFAVHRDQKLLEVAPWHDAGGTWTFFDAKTTDGIAFGFGFDATKAAGSMSFGKVILTVPGRDDGKRLVDLFAKRFRAPAPAERSAQPLAFRPFSAVFLASDAKRTSGGFAGKGGGYYATKLFLQRPSVEAEVFFNFNLTAKEGQFSEKDSDYAKDLVEFLALELRDGKAPRPTAATNPAMTDKGPRIVMGRTLPGRAFGWTPEKDRFLMKERIAGGGAKLVAHALAKDEPIDELKVPDDLGSLFCSGDRCIVENVKHKEEGVDSSFDPRTIMVADRKSHAVTKLDGPWSAKVTIALGTSVAPDGAIVLVEDLVPNPGGKTPFKHVLYVVDRKGAPKGPIDLGGEGWQVTSIAPAAQGSTILVRQGGLLDGSKAKKTYSTVDPKTGAVTPAAEPASSPTEGDERFLSPNGKKRISCTGGAILITELSNQKQSRFDVFDADKKAIDERCVEWASDRYALYASDWTAFLDTETMKLSDIGTPGLEEGRLYFDKTFTYVVHDASTTRVGRIEPAAK